VLTLSTLGAAGLAAAAVFGVQAGGGTTTVVGQASPAGMQPASTAFSPDGGRGFGSYGSGSGSVSGSGSGDGSSGASGSSSGSASTGSTGTATAAQEVGVVDIDTVLQYQNAQAAGTGMILTSTGEILTNNHVVDGATSITVTVVSTGATYTATVVGTDATDDVAVLQLQHASGLKTVSLSTAAARVGDAVTAVGNAGGTGGTPSAAPGRVTAVDRTITASDESGGNSEQLSGLIETDADVQSGDSGGPLYDSSGTVIGMDTAASSGGTPDGYAIPIATAVSIARQIEAGVDNATIDQGYPAFLGVSVQDGDGGAQVAGVASGSAADDAGLAAGDTITAVGGSAVTSADGLSTALESYSPGQRVGVSWTDGSGAAHSATVTLGSGPAA
jgi:S1-C subfamily serine protease